MQEIKGVIAAESFSKAFSQLKTPQALFPLVDELLLEHQIQWLQKNGIDEIIVLYNNPKIGEYLNNRKKTGKKLQCVIGVDIVDGKNIGDAFRELLSHNIIHQDFVFMYGDTMTNISLQAAIEKYQEQRKENKLNIMLMIMYQGKQTYNEEKWLYVVDEQNKLYQIDDLQKNKIIFNKNKDKINLNKGIPCKYKIFTNLIESGIYICHRDVLKGFQENFTFCDIKEDFLREMLTSEIQEEKIHLYIAPNTQISQRIFNPQCYHNACLKYVSKFFYPLSPPQKYHVDFFKYLLGKIDSKAIIKDQCFIGGGTQVGAKSLIDKSIIGKNCQINGQIIDSILWDNIIIDDGIIIKNCIISNGVHITKNMNDLIILNDQDNQLQYYPLQPLKVFNLFDDQKLEENEEVEDETQPHKVKQQEYSGLEEEMVQLVQQCENIELVKQAIINVDTLKVNKNKSFEEIISAFMPAFLNSLQPTIEDWKEKYSIWKEFINRFVQETEVVTYIKSLEVFCRNNLNYYLNTLLQLSYTNQILSEKAILNYINTIKQIDNDQFAQQFLEQSQQFQEFLEKQLEEEEQQQQDDYEYEYVYE